MACRSSLGNRPNSFAETDDTPSKRISEINFKESRIMIFGSIYPCKVITATSHNFVLSHLFRDVNSPNSNQKKREALRITVPFIDILNCHIGKLHSGTIILLKLRAASYSTFLQAFNKTNYSKDRSSPDYFLRIVTIKTVRSSEIRWIELSMKALNVDVFVLQGSVSFYSEQILKGLVSVEELLTAVPEAIDLDDDQLGDGEEDMRRKELIKSNGNNMIFCDFLTLFPRAYLNDSILDYYLNHIQTKFEKTHPHLRIAIVPAFRAEILIAKSMNRRHLPGTLEKLIVDKGIGSCDFLVLPLVKDQHWFMAIVTNLKQTFKYDFSDDSAVSVYEYCDMPKVIYFDSFENYFTANQRTEFNNKIFAFIRDCLIVHKQINHKQSQHNSSSSPFKTALTSPSSAASSSQAAVESLVSKFTKRLFTFIHPSLPQQTNNYDCGLFLLEFAEKFFERPLEISRLIQNDKKGLKSWFTPSRRDVTRSYLMEKIREEISPETGQMLEEYVVNNRRRRS